MNPKRLDALFSKLGYCTRGEAKKFTRINEVKEGEIRIFDVSKKVRHCDITVNNEPLDSESLTILMNKPDGVVCSHDDSGKLIYSLLPPRWQNRNPKLSTIGRLDRDTTGAILLSDDGELNHRLTSPKSVVPKVYKVTLAHQLANEVEDIFSSGTLMLNGDDKQLLPAKLTRIDDFTVLLEIVEGRYHQVKRMFGAVQNRVVGLHRVSFDSYTVDGLQFGEYKILNFK
jgi:16S rRNA pseudouridine516 synthase